MRYLPQTKDSREAMLESIGVKSVDDLYKDVPKKAFIKGFADITMHMGELEVERKLSGYANQNRAASQGPFFLGAGIYYHHIPASVDHIIQRSEYLTAYTPYQPEIAQGTLTAIFEFQTFIAQLTGQDIANASMYDGATATAEAALMAMRVTKRGKVVVGGAMNSEYTAVLDTYLDDVVYKDFAEAGEFGQETACIIIQSPDFIGQPQNYDQWRKLCDSIGAMMVVVVNEIVSLGLLPAPSIADIVCGEAQGVGVPMSFGGPHCGFFSCKEKFVRQMPGRLIGETVDADGKRGYVLTLNTREQHIRREKATSNICTNQGLMALAFTVHMALLGEDGFKRLARLNHESACRLADALEKVKGVKVLNKSFFNEFAIELPKKAKDVVQKLADKGIIAGYPLGDSNQLLVCATEMTTEDHIDALIQSLKDELK